MDSKNNLGHSADIFFTAESPIPIDNGNNSIDFKRLINKDSAIITSKLKDKAGIVGAYMLARSRMFES